MVEKPGRPPIPSNFSAFTVKHSGLVNRIVTEIGLTSAFDPQDPPVPPPKLHPTSALWDTGATSSCITPSTVKAVGLSPVGIRMVSHGGGSELRNTYMVNLYLPNRVLVAGVLVAEFAETGSFGVVIGMDVISQGDFSITNCRSQTWASFRIPSVLGIDYVEEANRIAYAGVGRNSPCPCGKMDAGGKPVKFKKCHGLRA
jgi:hypothetical protein